jgi:hypothetical protein
MRKEGRDVDGQAVRAALQRDLLSLLRVLRGGPDAIRRAEVRIPDARGIALDAFVAVAALGYQYRPETDDERAPPVRSAFLEHRRAPDGATRRFYLADLFDDRAASTYPAPGLLPTSSRMSLARAIRRAMLTALPAAHEAGRAFRAALAHEGIRAFGTARAIALTWRHHELPDCSGAPAVRLYLKAIAPYVPPAPPLNDRTGRECYHAARPRDQRSDVA